MKVATGKINGQGRDVLKGISIPRNVKTVLTREYQAIFKNNGKPMVIVEEDATISLANTEFEQLSGYTKEEIEGRKNWMEFVARDDRRRVREYHRLRKADPILSPRCFEFRFIDRHKKVKNIVLTIGSIPGTNKSMVSLLDVTDRRQEEISEGDGKERELVVKKQMTELEKANMALQAEVAHLKQEIKELQASDKRYRTLLDNVDFGINLIDADHTIVMANAIQNKRLNKPVSELIGKKCFQEFEKRDAVCSYCPGVRAMATGRPAEVETETIRDDLTHYPVRVQAFPIFGQDGKTSGFIEVVEDITERKRMDLNLRESEERFRMLAENSPLGISIMAPDKHFEYFNPRFTEIFGYTEEDIPDKDTWFEKAYPDDEYRKRIFLLWRRDREGDVKIGEGNPRVFTVRCKDGQDKIIDFRTVYLKDRRQYLIYEDITDRVRAEEALRESEERYRSFVENIDLGINLIDTDHNIVMVNAAQSRHFKKPISETIGKKCYQEFEKRDAVCPHCPGVQTIATGKPAEREAEGIRDDRSHFHVRLQTFPIFGKDGTVTAFIEVVEDITKRKEMEKALQQTEDKYRQLVETMHVGLTAIDQNGVLTYVNEQHCRMLGYSMEEMIGRPTVDFQDEETRKRQEEAFAKRRAGMRDSTPYEVTWVAKDGHKVHTILTPTPSFAADGRFTGSFAIFTDITERKRLEERLQRYAAELECINEEVKNFAYIVSHDLRVPLVNLKGYSSELRSAMEVIGSNFDAALPYLEDTKRSKVSMALHEDIPEALEFITTSVSRMDSFIEAVLQLSRLGRQDLKAEPLDMNALVQAVVENLAHQIRERGATVTVGPLPQVVADRTAMEQVMGNILGNAVKYLDPSRPGRIEVTAETNNGEQIFRIRDTGRGIAQEDMGKVFAPFRRAGKQDTPGEGMGLAYVQALVRRHGGRIWCESELGKGTTFSFTIAAPSENRVPDA